MAGGGATVLQETAEIPAGPVGAGERLVTLDFIRGIAVLGILLANIVGFAHPQLAYGWPRALPDALEDTNKALWLAQYVLIDGKMRGLFTLLFGAGIALFIHRAEARGNGYWLQARRLVWLGCFGLLHFYLLFWGDILALYAVAGLLALPLIALPARSLLGLGIVWYVAGGLFMAISFSGPIGVESGASPDAANPQAQELLREAWSSEMEGAAMERAAFTQGSYAAELRFMVEHRTEQLGQLPFFAFVETVPLILIGMALFNFGFFSGAIDRAAMRRWGWIGIALGTAATLPLGLWAMFQRLPALSHQLRIQRRGAGAPPAGDPGPCRAAGAVGAARLGKLAGRKAGRRRADGLFQLHRHIDPDDAGVPQLGRRAFRPVPEARPADAAAARLAGHARLVEAVAGAVPLWPARMVLALPDLLEDFPASPLRLHFYTC